MIVLKKGGVIVELASRAIHKSLHRLQGAGVVGDDGALVAALVVVVFNGRSANVTHQVRKTVDRIVSDLVFDMAAVIRNPVMRMPLILGRNSAPSLTGIIGRFLG